MRHLSSFILSIYSLSLHATDLQCGLNGQDRISYGCVPVVFVIRHAEDTPSGPHQLTNEGKKHAALYPQSFNQYIFGGGHHVGFNRQDACVCPIKKIISISDKNDENNQLSLRNPNPNPSSNPLQTVVPLSKSLSLTIKTDNQKTQYWSSFQWGSEDKLVLLDHQGNNADFSVIIAWDKQGLNPSEQDYKRLMTYLKAPESKVPYQNFTPLLKAFPKYVPKNALALDPLKTRLWIYSNQNPDGTFMNLDVYQQYFFDKNDCTGASFTDPKTSSQCMKFQSLSY